MQIDSKVDKKIVEYFRKHPLEAYSTISRLRESFEELAHALSVGAEKAVKVEDVAFPPLTFRIYRPENSLEAGTILFFHGGGFVKGSILSHDPFCRRLAHLSKWTVVSVDYRLAPESPFPAALKDAEVAYQWLREKGPRYGLDGVKIVVAGDSAGGTLAARLAQNHRLEIAGEILIFPWLDLSLSFPSYHLYGKGFFVETKPLIWCLDQYVPSNMDRRSPDLSPLWEKNLFEMPPTLLLAAELDPIVDEGKRYVDLLLEHGNEVQYEQFVSMPHGFILLEKIAKKAMDSFYEKIAAFLSTM